MDVISQFVARYVKEYDFYDQAARLVKERIEERLRASGVRCIVTSRAKNVPRLEEKCRKRNLTKNYASTDQIFDDMPDLAGVRVALYFPAERDEVDRVINDLFILIEPRRDFPIDDGRAKGKRFSGYAAQHYRVHLKDDDSSELDRRYALAKVEIQVASVLMHAWSEVEHDLVYKPFEGDLSEDEYEILDQLNGMVIAGEIALEALQRAGKRRVAEGGRKFRNHYELAAFLLSQVNHLSPEPISDAGLGRVDRLFALLRELKIDTPSLLVAYFDAVHGNWEVRPLAEQVIDAILGDDESRYEVYREIVQQGRGRDSTSESEGDVYRQIGLFLARWIELEILLLGMLPSPHSGQPGRPTPWRSLLTELDVLDDDMRVEIDWLRRVRNNVTHGREVPTPTELVEITRIIETITAEIRRRVSTKGDNPA